MNTRNHSIEALTNDALQALEELWGASLNLSALLRGMLGFSHFQNASKDRETEELEALIRLALAQVGDAGDDMERAETAMRSLWVSHGSSKERVA